MKNPFASKRSPKLRRFVVAVAYQTKDGESHLKLVPVDAPDEWRAELQARIHVSVDLGSFVIVLPDGPHQVGEDTLEKIGLSTVASLAELAERENVPTHDFDYDADCAA